MTKRITTPEPSETVTIPKSSFDNMFLIMEEMRQEIKRLNERLGESEKEDRMFSVQEAAEYVGRTRQTIAAWKRQGRISKVVRGGRVGFLKSELDKVRKL